MRLAELSSRSGLSAPTIKYYLRLGLLPAGETESATWAAYHEGHVRRLALIRALTDVGGLSLDQVRDVLATVDDPASTRHRARGAVQWPLSPAPATAPTPASLEAVDELLTRAGWELAPDSPHRRRLASQLDTLHALGFPATDEVLDAYAAAMEPVAAVEVARIAGEDPTTAAEHVVIGTVLYEPVLLSLRRIAHEVMSGRGRE